MRVIIFLLLCFGVVGCHRQLFAQTRSENYQVVNDSVLLYEKKSMDVIVNERTKSKKHTYKLKIPKIVDFNIKNLSDENEVFLRIKIISVKKAFKGAELLPDSLKNSNSNVFVEWEKYIPVLSDSIK